MKRCPPPTTRRKTSAFTLLEVMIVVAIIGILAALAAPSFTPTIKRWRVRDSAEALSSTLYYAHSEALKRGRGITIDATDGWNTGWKVNLTQNGTTTKLKVNAVSSQVSIDRSNSKTILYVDRWDRLFETSSGTPVAIDIALDPTDKSASDSSTLQLCMAGDGLHVQMKNGAAFRT